MDTTKKFQEAFDKLFSDFNAKIEEVRSNFLNLKEDVKVQVDGQKENLQEYGEKIKGRISQIVDVDKVRANILAEAENVVDDAKVRIEKAFQFVNEQIQSGEKRAKKAAANFSKKADKFTDELEDDVKKATADLQKKADKFANKVEKDVKKATAGLQKNVAKATKEAEKNINKVKKQVETKVEKVSKEVKASTAKATKEVKMKVAKAPVKNVVTPAPKKTTTPAPKKAAAPVKKAAVPAKKAAVPAKKAPAKKKATK
ncbi:MAG TPA: hypothetical protein PLJ42_04915 [Chitinophagales bacterium]|jgi:F0F1-type ATP synthase membrane subunit b/b'|nr:hypothetical protein [Chitinophagales bacterium]MBP6154104.1 hypothetical protein [Chitinophagales bacterium]HQV78035.1 hypothetical protein [Chitinophagales bacterium]HQW78756.1 hypothetical protein [Chitinophagales bacterium]HRB19559.1 hypothetical protein [Chitinophagales bacterium]